jgi:hypothetical protein
VERIGFVLGDVSLRSKEINLTLDGSVVAPQGCEGVSSQKRKKQEKEKWAFHIEILTEEFPFYLTERVLKEGKN